jgi:Leucine-rich repeat (LRR) protein
VVQLHNAGLVGPLPPALISLLPQLKVLVVHDNRLTGPSPLTLLSGEAVHNGHNVHVDSTGLDKLAKAMAVAKASKKLQHKLADARANKAASNDAAASRTGIPGVNAEDESVKMAAAPHHRSLVRLSGHGNRMTGKLGVLSCWLKLKLKDLTLGSNQFTGPIEPLFERWVESNDGRCALQVLNLDRNLLSGRFPRTLSCVRLTLKQLNLSHNRLEGPLEGRVLGQLAVLERLVLSHNKFTGKLPDQLSSLATSLQQLVVSHNALTGLLPGGALGYLTKLRTLDLQHNRLEGHVPPFFSKMTDLRELNLGFNELEGALPLAALAAFQRHQKAEKRLKVLVLQPNPRMVQPSAEEVAALVRALPCTNVAVAWNNYTF